MQCGNNTFIQFRSKGTKHPILYFFDFLWAHAVNILSIYSIYREIAQNFTVDISPSHYGTNAEVFP